MSTKELNTKELVDLEKKILPRTKQEKKELEAEVPNKTNKMHLLDDFDTKTFTVKKDDPEDSL